MRFLRLGVVLLCAVIFVHCRPQTDDNLEELSAALERGYTEDTVADVDLTENQHMLMRRVLDLLNKRDEDEETDDDNDIDDDVNESEIEENENDDINDRASNIEKRRRRPKGDRGRAKIRTAIRTALTILTRICIGLSRTDPANDVSIVPAFRQICEVYPWQQPVVASEKRDMFAGEYKRRRPGGSSSRSRSSSSSSSEEITPTTTMAPILPIDVLTEIRALITFLNNLCAGVNAESLERRQIVLPSLEEIVTSVCQYVGTLTVKRDFSIKSEIRSAYTDDAESDDGVDENDEDNDNDDDGDDKDDGDDTIKENTNTGHNYWR